ncbi:citrate lyase holo-[acyl-carrier protein] synthase [Enterococcus faecalis]
MSELWQRGEPMDIVAMMQAREKRAHLQQALLKNAKTATLICATMNIPGPIKNNPLIAQTFSIMQQHVQQITAPLQQQAPILRNLNTGPEWFCLVNQKAPAVKRWTVELEETTFWGRLVDLDVLVSQAGVIHTLSREAFGYPPRKCLLCPQPAKICGRQRTHSVEKMQQQIEQLLKKGETQ